MYFFCLVWHTETLHLSTYVVLYKMSCTRSTLVISYLFCFGFLLLRTCIFYPGKVKSLVCMALQGRYASQSIRPLHFPNMNNTESCMRTINTYLHKKKYSSISYFLIFCLFDCQLLLVTQTTGKVCTCETWAFRPSHIGMICKHLRCKTRTCMGINYGITLYL